MFFLALHSPKLLSSASMFSFYRPSLPGVSPWWALFSSSPLLYMLAPCPEHLLLESCCSFFVCLKHCNAIFQLWPCPGVGVIMDMKAQWFKDLLWSETWQTDIKDLASSIDGHQKRFLRKALSRSSISMWMKKPTKELDLTESRKTRFPGLCWEHLAALTPLQFSGSPLQ